MSSRLFLFSLCLFVSASIFADTAAPARSEPESVDAEKAKSVASETIALHDAIQPRQAGAFWLYKSVIFEAGKPVPNGISREEVLEVSQIDGVAVFHVRLTMDWRSLLDKLGGAQLEDEDYWHFWEYFNGKGSYHYDAEDEDRARPKKLSDFDLTLPYPVEAGKQYVMDAVKYEVIDTARKVTVPAGEFECVVYQMTYPYEEGDEWISRDRLFMAKGVGLVVAEGDVKEGGNWVLDYRDELTSYNLKLEDSEQTEAHEKK